MKVKLKDIADIQSGFYQKPKDKGDVIYIQAKDFQSNHFTCNNNTHIISSGKIDKHILNKGDVLLASKGVKTFAWSYKTEIGPAVASSTFFVIRIIDNRILPEYLTAILNHRKTIQYFDKLSVGSNIKTIKINVLKNFEVPVIEIQEQKKLINFLSTWEQEKQLTLEIIGKKEKMYQATFFNKLNK